MKKEKIIKRKNYSDEEVFFLKENYLELTDEEIAIKFNRPTGSIKKKRERLGLLRFYQEQVAPIKGEIWKEIKGHEQYFVSNKGRVKNEKGIIKIHYNKRSRRTQFRAKTKNNYETFPVHKIVAVAFCDKPCNYKEMEIHHIDFNPLNNCSDNLIFLSHEEHLKAHNKKIKTK